MQNPRPGQEFWSALIDTAPYLDRNAYAVRSRMDYQINDGLAFSYIAGYSKFDGSSDYDQDGGVQVPTSFATGSTFQDDRTNYSHYESNSHEFDLKSTGDNTLDWILGLYYAAEDNSIRFDIPIFNGTPQGTVGWQGSFIQPKETVNSYAGFGQAIWHISDTLRLTGGARWTHDEKENEGGRGWGWAYDANVPQVPITPGTIPSAATGFGLGVSGINDGKYSASKPTWLLRVDGDISSDAFWYGSISTGYKSGGLAGRRHAVRGRDAHELRGGHQADVPRSPPDLEQRGLLRGLQGLPALSANHVHRRQPRSRLLQCAGQHEGRRHRERTQRHPRRSRSPEPDRLVHTGEDARHAALRGQQRLRRPAALPARFGHRQLPRRQRQRSRARAGLLGAR